MKLSANMIRLYQTYGFQKMIDVFSEANVPGIDFNADLPDFYAKAHNKTYYDDILKYARDKGVEFVQAHAPFASSFDDEEQTRQRFTEITDSIKYASWLDSKMIVVHPCNHLDYEDPALTEKVFETNVEFYKKLIPYSEEYGIKIALENINFKGRAGVTSTAERLAALYDELNNDAFVVCFDVGHMNILGLDPSDAIRTLGNRIKCLHVHDNMGDGDTHTLPYYGNIEWESVMAALAAVGYDGDLSYEASLFLKNLPPVLYPEGLKYMSLIGHHLIDRFEHYKLVI